MITPFKSVSEAHRSLVYVGTTIVGLALWALLHVTNPVIPGPAAVASAWLRLGQDGLLFRLYESYVLNVIALAVSSAISFGFAYLTVIEVVKPTVAAMSKLRFLGFTGLTFIFGMYFEDRTLQVWLLVFGITTFFLTSMMAVVASVPQSRLDHARTLRMGPWRTLWEVVVRGTFDQALDVFRQSAAMGWMMLTMVEGLVRSKGGIGIVLLDLNRRLLLDGILAVVLTILAVGIVQDWALTKLRALLCPYTVKA